MFSCFLSTAGRLHPRSIYKRKRCQQEQFRTFCKSTRGSAFYIHINPRRVQTWIILNVILSKMIRRLRLQCLDSYIMLLNIKYKSTLHRGEALCSLPSQLCRCKLVLFKGTLNRIQLLLALCNDSVTKKADFNCEESIIIGGRLVG